jgi:hypothetical protein
MGPEIRRISGRFGAADTLCSATHFEGAETYADMSRIPGLKTHHGSLHFRTNFGPLNSASFQSDFASMDTVKLWHPLPSTLQGRTAWARFSTSYDFGPKPSHISPTRLYFSRACGVELISKFGAWSFV